jgi:hypothetical protein
MLNSTQKGKKGVTDTKKLNAALNSGAEELIAHQGFGFRDEGGGRETKSCLPREKRVCLQSQVPTNLY